MKSFSEKATDVVTTILGGFLGGVCILGVFIVPLAVVMWAFETIVNFFR